MNKNRKSSLRYRIIYTILLNFFVFSIPIYAQDQSKTDTQTPDLARIAILQFEDRTGTGNFNYMSESLSDAVNASMLKNFTYERIEPAEVNGAFDKARAKFATKDPKADSQNFNNSEEIFLNILKEMAKELNADIIIFGNYTFNEESQNLVIAPGLYYSASKERADLPVVSNKVDNTIFNVTARTAKNIISEIQRIAEQAPPAEVSDENDNGKKAQPEPTVPGAKIVLTKKLTRSFSRFKDNYNGTIIDNKTGLLWQKCELTANSKSKCSNTKPVKTWESAAEYCENLTISGKRWSLPNIDELESIVNTKAKNPAIYVLFAPYTDGFFSPYWSSTLTKDEKDAQVVRFSNGSIIPQAKIKKSNVRCVCRDNSRMNEIMARDSGQKTAKIVEPFYPTFGGMFIRTLLIPGSGLIYAGQGRGWIYFSLWLGTAGTFTYSFFNYVQKYDAYHRGLQGLDVAYTDYKDALQLRNYAFLSLLGVYAISMIDILISGGFYTKPKEKTLSYNFGIIQENLGQQYVQTNYSFALQRRF